MSEKSALDHWRGEFGDAYIERNAVEPWRVDNARTVFDRVLGGRRPASVLEVGANVGINLIGLRSLDDAVELSAVEPNPAAFERLTARADLRLSNAHNCSGQKIPLDDGAVELAFTSGVLIHVPPSELPAVTDEMVRVTRRFVLCIEYFSHEPVEIAYHGLGGLLFKRDFGAYYLDRFPGLRVVDYGFLWQRELPHYDDLNWWLLEKEQR